MRASSRTITIKSASGTAPQLVRLRDVARVELSQQSFSNFSRFTGHKSAQIVVFALPGANAIQVADRVYAAMAEMSKQFPEGMKYAIRYDTTLFVREAIRAVYDTLFIAGVLVLDRHPRVPAELPGHAGSGHHRAGHHHRRLHRHGRRSASP